MKHFSFKVFVAICFLGVALLLVTPTLSYGAEKNTGCWEGNTGFWKSIGCTVGKGIDAVGGIFGNKKETPASIIPAPMQSEETLINENVERIIADAEFKTREFQSVKKEYQEAKTAEERTETLAALVLVAESRKESMKALMEKDPQEFLLKVITQNERAQLPPEVQKNIEKETSLSGDIQTIHYDDFANKKSREEYFIISGNERLKFFPVGLEAPIISQTKVRVQGFRLDDRVAVLVNNKNFSVVSTVSLDTSGPQKVLVLLVNFLDSGAPPFTPEEAKKLIFDGQAQKFFKDQSYGKTYFEGDVFGWYTYQKNSTDRLWSDDPEFADMVQKYKIDLKQYGYVLFVGHGNVGAGWSTAGKHERTVNGVQYKFATSFIGGSHGTGEFLAPSGWGQQPFSWTNLDHLLGHELGHALGVMHANSLQCSDGFIMNGPSCWHVEYGNYYDTMGSNSYSLSFNALFKEILGWLDDSSIQTISTSGRYELRPLENPNGIRGAKVKIRGSDETAFYLEYRRGIGFDTRLNEPRFASNQNGLFINKYIDSLWPEFPLLAFPRLLDITPVPMGSWDKVTLNKETGIFRDPVSGITIGPIISADGEKIVFDVRVEEPQCAPSYPTITSNYDQNVVSGMNFYSWFRVNNVNSKKCPITNFTTTFSLPEGCRVEKTEHESNSIMIPGDTFSIKGGETKQIQVMSFCPSTITEGRYTATLFANDTQDATKRARKEIQLYIINPLSVEISPDSPLSQKITKGMTKFSLLKFNVKNNSNIFSYSLSIFEVRFSSGGVSFDILKDGVVLKENVKFGKGFGNVIVNVPEFRIEPEKTASFEIRASIDQDNEADKIRVGIYYIHTNPYMIFSKFPLYGNWMYLSDTNIVPKITITEPSSEITVNRGERFKLSWNAKNFPSLDDAIFLDIMSGTEGKENEMIQSYGGSTLVGFLGDFFIDTSWFPPDGTYRIRIREPNSGAEALSEKITIKTLPLATPTYFGAWYSYVDDVGLIKNKVNLAWVDVSSAEDGFEIWRSIDDEGFAPFPEIGRNVTSAVDSFSSSTTWTTLRYKIRAYQIETICSSWKKPLRYLKFMKRVLPCEETKIYSDFSPFASPDDNTKGSIVPGDNNSIVGSEIKIPLKDLVEIRIQDKDSSFFIKGLTPNEIIFSAPPKMQKTKLDALFNRDEKIYQDAWSVTK